MSVPYPRITRWHGHRTVVCSRGVLVHRPSCLDAAAPVLLLNSNIVTECLQCGQVNVVKPCFLAIM